MASPVRRPEFEVTEQPHLVQPSPDLTGTTPWGLLCRQVKHADDQLRTIEVELRKAKEGHTAAKRRLLLGLIEDVMDNLDRSVQGVQEQGLDPAAARWFKRLQRVRRAVEQVLARERVVAIDLVSAPPGLVDAGGVEDRDDVPDGTILEVVWTGYLWDGELLRKAKVIVARNPAGPA